MGDRAGRLGVVLATASLALATACTTMVGGTAVPAASGPVTSAAVGAAADVVAPPADVVGRRLESHRLAGATALVQDTFPDRSTGCGYSPVVDATRLEPEPFPDGTAADVLEKYGFVSGWLQCWQDRAGQQTLAMSLEVSDPGSAVRAVTELAEAAREPTMQVSTASGGATALVRTDGPRDIVQVYGSVGRTIAYTAHLAPAGQGLEGAVRMNTAQLRLLAGFVPTPQTDVPNLPLDPGGLAARVFDTPGARADLSGPFDLEAYLRISRIPARQRDLLTANGFVGAYVKETDDEALAYSVVLFAFADPVQADAAYRQFADLEHTAIGNTDFRVPAIPDAPCSYSVVTALPPTYYQRCLVGHGQYVVAVDVGGLTAPDDVAAMTPVLTAQRDLIAA
jgi:hypothetical protein